MTLPAVQKFAKFMASTLQVVAHSVGTWVAYELLRLAQSQRLPMPRKAFLSAMASPDIAIDARPWRQQRTLAGEDFKVRLWWLGSPVWIGVSARASERDD